ncbi:MAG: DUF6164 family protein [Zetaproteobacteria bacterium]|nr:MAG: DUF6164 family protein [Zetaproteobacteria bacterium]
MSVRLFNLRNVPDDEADEVRQLLAGNEIDFYETHAGGWGVSSPAIWLHDNSRLEQAKELIKAYQRERAATARTAYEQLRREGRHPTLMYNIRRHPLQFILLVLMALFILYVSLSPFLRFGS